MTIRSTVKKVDRYGIQGATSFDPTHPNANVALYRELEKFLKSDQGLGGSGGVAANRLADSKSYQASHVFTTPAERDAVQERLLKQYQEQFEPKIADMAKASGMSFNEYLRSQGIQPIQYRPDDFILASQNPLRSSTEKKIKAFMSMAGNTQSISGGTGEHRRHTGYYRPNDLKHVRSILSTEARRLNEGRANIGEMEGLYLPASQKLEARTAQSIFKNGLTEDLLNNEKHPIVEKIRSDMLKQHATTQLKAKVKKGLKDEELLPPDEEKEKERKQSPAAAASKGIAGVVLRMNRVLLDIKSLTSSSLAYLQKMTSLLSNLLSEKGKLGVTQAEAERLQDMGRFHEIYTGGDDNVFLNSANAFAQSTGDILRGDKLDYDSLGAHKFPGLIDIIIKGATKGLTKPQPVQTMKEAYNFMAQRYYETPEALRDTKLSEILLSLDATVPGSSRGFNTAVLWGNANGVNSKNAYKLMEMMEQDASTGGGKNRIATAMGGRVGSSRVSKESEKDVDKLKGFKKRVEDEFMKSILANLDKIIAILLAIGAGILKFAAITEDDEFGPMHQAYKDLVSYSQQEGTQGYYTMTRSAARVKSVLMDDLEQNGYKGWNAENNIIKPFLNAKTRQEETEIFQKYHPDLLKQKNFKQVVIGLSKYKQIKQDIESYLSQDPTDRRFRGNGDLDNYYRKNDSTQTLLRSLHLDDEIKESDYKRVFKRNVGDDLIRKEYRSNTKSNTTGIDGSFLEESIKKFKPLAINNSFEHISFLNRAGSFLSLPSLGGTPVAQGTEATITHNVVLTVNGKEILKSSNEFNAAQRYFENYTRHTIER